jgi:hypothetical protein
LFLFWGICPALYGFRLVYCMHHSLLCLFLFLLISFFFVWWDGFIYRRGTSFFFLDFIWIFHFTRFSLFLHHALFYISFGKTHELSSRTIYQKLPRVERDGGGEEGAASNEGGETKEKTHMYLFFRETIFLALYLAATICTVTVFLALPPSQVLCFFATRGECGVFSPLWRGDREKEF